MRNDAELLDHILDHIDNDTTDLGDEEWYEPVEHYASQARFDAERLCFFNRDSVGNDEIPVHKNVADAAVLEQMSDKRTPRLHIAAERHRHLRRETKFP